MGSKFNHAPSYEPKPSTDDSAERPRLLVKKLEGHMAAIAVMGAIGFNVERSSANLPPATGDHKQPTEPSADETPDA